MSLIPDVTSAAKADRDRAINALVLGFAADPMTRWFWPDAETYVKTMPRFAMAFGGRAFDKGTAHIADGCRAVALWLPPGVGPDEEAMGQLVEEALGLRPEIAEDANGVFEGMAKYHPHEPHWYLPLIACDPNWINRGLGAALMKHALAKCDEDGLPAYLESSNPRNIAFYERHGFKAIGEIRSGSAPVMTPMLRAPRRERS